MIHFDLLTILPKMFEGFLSSTIYRRAIEAKIFDLSIHDIRQFSTDRHKSVDDVPYGGGPGMVIKPEPVVAAIEHVQQLRAEVSKPLRIYLTPKGERLNQGVLEELLDYDALTILCGRYQGVDQRVVDGWIDRELSVGDYVVGGGEVPAMIVVEALVRLLPGVLHNPQSLEGETHSDAFPEAPIYTRPPQFRGRVVPKVLMSGDHEAIERWRREASKTAVKREKG